MPRNLWKPKVNQCVHNSPPLNPNLGQLNPHHNAILQFFKIYSAYHPPIYASIFHVVSTLQILQLKPYLYSRTLLRQELH